MRVLVRILSAIAVLALLGAALFWIPPHVQTRRIAPPLPSRDELRGLLAVAGGPTRVRTLTIASQPSPRGTIGHTVFLAEWPDGRAFMLDAGMDHAAADDFAGMLKTMAGAGEAAFFGDVADQLGADLQRVQGVGFTHLHIDHTQGVGAFCKARGQGAAVYQTHWQIEEHNFNTREGAKIIADSCLEPRALAGDGGLLAVPGFPGLAVVALGGHTPDSTLFALAVQGRLWLFSGDTTNTKASLLNDVGKGFLYSYVLVPENTARTHELRQWLAKLDAEDDISVVVSHDLDDILANGPPAYVKARR
jgi:glyoxylase-like metal-dependent hydrolase (beta-lactamase superfamily II)